MELNSSTQPPAKVGWNVRSVLIVDAQKLLTPIASSTVSLAVSTDTVSSMIIGGKSKRDTLRLTASRC
jgi:hypothetical protein